MGTGRWIGYGDREMDQEMDQTWGPGAASSCSASPHCTGTSPSLGFRTAGAGPWLFVALPGSTGSISARAEPCRWQSTAEPFPGSAGETPATCCLALRQALGREAPLLPQSQVSVWGGCSVGFLPYEK